MCFLKIDLNLFVVFEVIYNKCNLMCVVEVLNFMQLVVSNVLVWLCKMLNDLLFVSMLVGMMLMLMVENIVGCVCEVL